MCQYTGGSTNTPCAGTRTGHLLTRRQGVRQPAYQSPHTGAGNKRGKAGGSDRAEVIGSADYVNSRELPFSPQSDFAYVASEQDEFLSPTYRLLRGREYPGLRVAWSYAEARGLSPAPVVVSLRRAAVRDCYVPPVCDLSK